MKKFRSLYIIPNEKFNVGMHPYSKASVPAICLNVNDSIIFCFNYDYYRKIKKDPLIMDDTYSLSLDKSGNVGIEEIPDQYVNFRWYEKNSDSTVIKNAWSAYNESLNLGEIIKYQIYRDSRIVNDNIRYLDNMFSLRLDYALPSWDVCVALPLYAYLCEEIPGFDKKFANSSDLVGQIRGNLKKLNKYLVKGRPIDLNQLDELLKVIHNLTDEFELAYYIKSIGYEIEFGNSKKGEPDYIINGTPVELKSAFPDIIPNSESTGPDLKFDGYATRLSLTEPTGEDFKKDMLANLKLVDKGLEKARICFYNITRPYSSVCFYKDALLGKFDLYKDCLNLNKVIRKSIDGHDRMIIPYVKPVCSEPGIISFPITYNNYIEYFYNFDPLSICRKA
jgi:hypothetical protein